MKFQQKQNFNKKNKKNKKVMEKSTTIKDRILKIAENKGINKTKFVESLEQKYTNYRGPSKKSAPSSEVIAKISTKYNDINIDWVLTGKGNMLRTDENSTRHTVITVDTQGNENIIFVPVKASAGYLNGYADPEYMHQLPAYRMPGINNGVFRMFEISGQSMQPTLENGDKIVGEWLPPADIKDGQVYIVVSKADGICVKRCINRLKNDNHLILQSDNKEFADIIIYAEDILEVWSVKLRITCKINNPSINLSTENWNNDLTCVNKFNTLSETNKRVADLEDRLTYTEARLTSRLAFIEKKFLTKP